MNDKGQQRLCTALLGKEAMLLGVSDETAWNRRRVVIENINCDMVMAVGSALMVIGTDDTSNTLCVCSE